VNYTADRCRGCRSCDSIGLVEESSYLGLYEAPRYKKWLIDYSDSYDSVLYRIYTSYTFTGETARCCVFLKIRTVLYCCLLCSSY
jgi:hypothetical protein